MLNVDFHQGGKLWRTQHLKLNKGDNAPQFQLTDSVGKNFSFSEAFKEGSSLLLFSAMVRTAMFACASFLR
jgi:peroxiredoxin